MGLCERPNESSKKEEVVEDLLHERKSPRALLAPETQQWLIGLDGQETCCGKAGARQAYLMLRLHEHEEVSRHLRLAQRTALVESKDWLQREEWLLVPRSRSGVGDLSKGGRMGLPQPTQRAA